MDEQNAVYVVQEKIDGKWVTISRPKPKVLAETVTHWNKRVYRGRYFRTEVYKERNYADFHR